MAATHLNRSTFVRIPPRSVGERAFASAPVLEVLAPAAPGAPRAWERMSLEAFPAVRAVTLLLDARDVTLLPVRMPPLSGRRLTQALPNLLEERLLQEPTACAAVVGPALADGERLVAVVDRGWLEFVVGAFERRGMRVDAAWPAQLTIPVTPGRWAATVFPETLALRMSATQGVGWTALWVGDEDPLEAALVAALRLAPRPEGIDFLLADGVDADRVRAAAERVGIACTCALPGTPEPAPLDLLAGRSGSAGLRWAARVDWRTWRVPAALLAACLAVWLIGLNLHWAMLARERAALRSELTTLFRDAFPGAQVIVDPVLQMQRQVADLRLKAGRSAPGDFLPLLARFSEALGGTADDLLMSLEYREARLRARPRTGAFDDPARREAVRAAARQRGLKLEFEGEAETLTVVVEPQA